MRNCDNTPPKLVSIVIPSFLAQGTLRQCLESLVGAKGLLEIIVCINGFDSSALICEEFVIENPDMPLRVLQPLETDLAMSANWTRACEAAKGKYLKLLCADDLLIVENLEKQIEFLEEHVGLEFVSGKRTLINDSGKVIKSSFGGIFLKPLNSLNRLMLVLSITGTNPIGEPSSVLFRAQSVRKNLPWSDDSDYVIDLDMYFRILSNSPGGRFGFINQNVSKFRISKESQSYKLSTFQNQQFKALVRQQFITSRIPYSFFLLRALSLTSPCASFLRGFVYRVLL
jgi:glycosyltransferase involved in cell wall biosynthesis